MSIKNGERYVWVRSLARATDIHPGGLVVVVDANPADNGDIAVKYVNPPEGAYRGEFYLRKKDLESLEPELTMDYVHAQAEGKSLNRLGVWVVGHSDFPFAVEQVFQEEIDALRYAVTIGGKPVFLPFGVSLSDAVRAAEKNG